MGEARVAWARRKMIRLARFGGEVCGHTDPSEIGEDVVPSRQRAIDSSVGPRVRRERAPPHDHRVDDGIQQEHTDPDPDLDLPR